jgi:hypothetical protein
MGVALGSWVIPFTLTLVQEGFGGLAHVPRELGIFASAPTGIDPRTHRVAYNVIQIINAVLCIAGGGIAGTLGNRLWHFLVVEKLQWVSDAQLSNVKSQNAEEAFGRAVISTVATAEEAKYRLDAWDILFFVLGLAAGIGGAMAFRAGPLIAGLSALAFGLAALRVRRYFVRIPELTADELAIKDPWRRVQALLLVSFGLTAAVVGVLATAMLGIGVATSGLKPAELLVVPIGIALLGVWMAWRGARLRRRS